MASEVSQNISNTLKSINLEKPTFSTLAQKGNDPLVQQFLSENMELGNEEKETVQSQLYIACFWGFHEVVKTLIERGADVNHKNADTLWTPLHAAAFQENGKIIMFLLEHNANPYSKDFGERTPADFASVSDKIWPLFAACGCTKSSRMILVEKGILRKKEVSMQHLWTEMCWLVKVLPQKIKRKSLTFQHGEIEISFTFLDLQVLRVNVCRNSFSKLTHKTQKLILKSNVVFGDSTFF
ncbi:ankyrin repeat and SOCS box protein 11-like isoform X2 [Hydractinia symbiolongicarpus]|uniref:ankyrin repeat and SOCS box protein 11-like isoform X2 n=1 Tax=Hydractinia symbiolongicarpus TaxID=13093 RepID=UPI00254FD08B|nr:ankyrin repeat and SOCS box protein 11-like isoform X2 [Hydractinia symbiolongicarpus]